MLNVEKALIAKPLGMATLHYLTLSHGSPRQHD